MELLTLVSCACGLYLRRVVVVFEVKPLPFETCVNGVEITTQRYLSHLRLALTIYSVGNTEFRGAIPGIEVARVIYVRYQRIFVSYVVDARR
jgi:hypothetical protein